MENKTIEPTELKDMVEMMKNARKDDTPYAAYGDKNLSVIGDANKTENKTVDISLTYRFTKDELEKSGIPIPENAKIVGNYVMIDTIYKDLALSPRKDMKMVENMMDFMPIFHEVEELYDAYKKRFEEVEEQFGCKYIEPKNKDDVLSTTSEDKDINDTMINIHEAYEKEMEVKFFHICAGSSDKMIDALYNVVAIFLGVDDFNKDHMMAYSVFGCILQLMITYPELFNEIETVFIR